MLLRKFNASGLEKFREFIGKLKVDKTLVPPADWLEDGSLTEIIQPSVDCPDATFSNRLQAAIYLDSVLSGVATDIFSDVGLWSWLAMRFFPELMPLNKPDVPDSHKRRLGVDAPRFIPSEHYTDRHRHLLRHPLQVFRMADRRPERAMCFLVQPVYRPGDLIEQFASREMYSWYKGMLAPLSRLVVDPVEMKIKPNASTKARRLDDLLGQFDCTWDLGSISDDHLIALLPDEFSEFRTVP